MKWVYSALSLVSFAGVVMCGSSGHSTAARIFLFALALDLLGLVISAAIEGDD